MLMESNLTVSIIVDKEVGKVLYYLIAIPTFIGIPIGFLNCILLAYSSRYWKQVRNKAEYVNDANYKTATVNYVKFGLSSLIIFLEIILFLFEALIKVMNEIPKTVTDYYHIERDFYFKLRDQFSEPIILVLAIVPLSLFCMLCLFLIKVIANSNIDFSILRRECMRTFWVCIVTIALSTVGNALINRTGVIVTDIVQIYFCWLIYKRMKKLYITLKSKCLDYLYEPKKYRYFRSQVTNYKWSSLIVGIFGGGLIISNAILTMYESVFKNVIYFLIPQSHISPAMSTQINSAFFIGYSIFGIIERISLMNWTIVSTLLNVFLLFTFIRKAYKYRQLVSKPFHIKLMHGDTNQRLIYKRVYY